MKVESYAYDYEDYILFKIFHSVKQGFYISIGENDPTINNVTRKFYHEGWHGINIVTENILEDYNQMRPKDYNISCNTSRIVGENVQTLLSDVLTRIPRNQNIHFCCIGLGVIDKGNLESIFNANLCRPMVLVIRGKGFEEDLNIHYNYNKILELNRYSFFLKNGNSYFYADQSKEHLISSYCNRLNCEYDDIVSMEVDCEEISKHAVVGRFESYSQYYEDFFLHEALKYIEKGFYIDVGANDPIHFSVTQHFYDLGWRGINIEPLLEHCIQLEDKRPEDINLCMGLGKEEGKLELLECDACSSFAQDVIQKIESEGKECVKRNVYVSTLSNIYREYCRNIPIHFCKIDVEGFEDQVLAGVGNWEEFRPWVYVIEATEPGTVVPTHEKWENFLLENGYVFVTQICINRYYVDANKKEIIDNLKDAANRFANVRIITMKYGDDIKRFPNSVKIGESYQTVIAKDPGMSRLAPDETSAGFVSLSSVDSHEFGLDGEDTKIRLVYHFNYDFYLDSMSIYFKEKKDNALNIHSVEKLMKHYGGFSTYVSTEQEEGAIRINWKFKEFNISLFVSYDFSNVVVYIWS